MATSHLKRLNAPKSWKIKRRGLTFITRPNPGPHTMELCMPINVLLRDMLGYAKTNKEVKTIIHSKEIAVNGKAIRDISYPVGLFDVLQIQKLDESYRMLIDSLGYLILTKVDKKEAKLFPAKIINKTILRGGKEQLNLSAGLNIVVEKNNFKTGETLMLDMPSKNIVEHLKLDKGAYIFLNGGSHVGDHGTVEEIKEGRVFYKSAAGATLETLKRFAIVVGKDKPMITIAAK
jgi:small subunit ribosomal protein S4e